MTTKDMQYITRAFYDMGTADSQAHNTSSLMTTAKPHSAHPKADVPTTSIVMYPADDQISFTHGSCTDLCKPQHLMAFTSS